MKRIQISHSCCTLKDEYSKAFWKRHRWNSSLSLLGFPHRELTLFQHCVMLVGGLVLRVEGQTPTVLMFVQLVVAPVALVTYFLATFNELINGNNPILIFVHFLSRKKRNKALFRFNP